MNVHPGLGASFSARPRGPRVLLYSHDTFGLGHLRRSRAIANAIACDDPDASVLIATGSPVVGSFDYGDGVDCVRLPGVVKQANGDYTSLNLRVPIEEAVGLREALIRQTALTFAPDVLIVDKEPTGFRGELLPTLEIMKARGARIVLGVRDVLDEPELLVPEWERKGATTALMTFFDDVWVYGLKEIYEPMAALPLPQGYAEKIRYTGYIKRGLPDEPHLTRYPKVTRGPFVLVTTGGGGDGEALIDWVISAYEADAGLMGALVVFGPFIPREARRRFAERINRLPHMDSLAFDAKLEFLMNRAEAVIAMGGYNTFCEVLSLDKRALIVPRARPRLEQTIRARRAAELGLVSVLEDPLESDAGARDAAVMAAAIRRVLTMPRPSETYQPGLLDGLDTIVAEMRRFAAAPRPIDHPASFLTVAAQ